MPAAIKPKIPKSGLCPPHFTHISLFRLHPKCKISVNIAIYGVVGGCDLRISAGVCLADAAGRGGNYRLLSKSQYTVSGTIIKNCLHQPKDVRY